MDSPHRGVVCVNKRWVDYGGAKVKNQHIIDDATGRKVDGTVEIEIYGFVARSVPKMFKIIPICSAHVANIIGRLQKKL